MPLTLFAEVALLPSGWAKDVRLTIREGTVTSVDVGATAWAGDERVGVLLPGITNLHSHTFQRAMAGLAERRGPGADSFWSWRDVMYRHALAMRPQDVAAVAAQAFVEMMESGFTRVCEFHYLHHDQDGRPYGDPAEHAAHLCAAAEMTGIGLTLLPVFYTHGGFGGAAAREDQRRFLTTLDGFARLHEASAGHVRHLAGGRIGIAPHSLRAVSLGDLARVVEAHPGGPIHIHVAEQIREVEECVAWSGARPVDLLMDHAHVDARWCLIHATHMRASETRRLARSRAVAGLCPITEANLGDGIFDGARLLAAGGRFGVGTDSNVRIDLAGELTQLEYSQRLRDRARNVLADPGGSTGRRLFDGALAGGAQAAGWTHGVAVGHVADLVSLNTEDTALQGRGGDDILDAMIFAARRPIDRVWVMGRETVRGGSHMAREAVTRAFSASMAALTA